jgi:hypothetical protein
LDDRSESDYIEYNRFCDLTPFRVPNAIIRLVLLIALLLAYSVAAGYGGGFRRQLPAVNDSAAISAQGIVLLDHRSPFRFFAPDSVWNRKLPADIPLDPDSTQLVSRFAAMIASERMTWEAPFIDTTHYSVPIYTVPVNEPTVRVKIVNGSKTLQAAWDEVPLPSNARPAAGTDKQLVVWQPRADRLWEFWHLEQALTGWQAGWGGAMEKVSSNPGAYGPEAWPGAKPSWGASASSLSIAGGLITLQDLERGQINHALAMAIPHPRARVFVSPAQRTDGRSAEPLSLPEGAHLRLDPHLNLAALHLPRMTLMIADAAQRYGIVVRDTAAVVVFYAQDPTPTGTEPYTGASGYFEGKTPTQLLESFPWSHLQVLRMTLHRIGPGRR